MDKIKSFSQYCEDRDENAENADKGLADIDAMPNEDELLLKMAKMAINRHQDRFLEFFRTLGKNDDDIKRVLGQFRDKRRNYLPMDLRKGSEQEEKDVVAPNTADAAGAV
jgi:hypothetical protein